MVALYSVPLLRHGRRKCETYDILYKDVYISEASVLLRHGRRNCEAYDIMQNNNYNNIKERYRI